MALPWLLTPLPSRAHAQENPACGAPEARQFDFWIGEWDVVNRQRNPARPDDATRYRTGTSTDRVYPILDGCAIVEHWEGYLSHGHVLGFSVRAWDPEKGAWVILLNWPGAGGPGFSTLEGGFEDGTGSFFRDVRRPDGTRVQVRFRFRDITADRLTWEGARSIDGGVTWNTFWTMDFVRRVPVIDPGLLRGPSRIVAPRCDREHARAFDFLVGDWIGEETVSTTEGRLVRTIEVEAWSILEGCAVMDFVTTQGDDVERKRFHVRSFIPGESRWIQYTLDRSRPAFVRWRGESGDGKDRVLVRDRPDGGLERVRWTGVRDDGYRREVSVSSDGGATWRTVAEADLERRRAERSRGTDDDGDEEGRPR